MNTAKVSFRLRPLQSSDAPILAKYANNPKVAANLTDAFPHPYSQDHAEAFIEKVSEGKPVTVLAIEINGEVAGAIGLHPQTDIQRMNAELGYWLAEPYWGKGIMTEAVRQMVAYGFANLEINRIFARPFGTNLASQRLLEKAGFVLEARFPIHQIPSTRKSLG
jgi:[ribosomal protein S5]-alanine N-acetyltransferase